MQRGQLNFRRFERGLLFRSLGRARAAHLAPERQIVDAGAELMGFRKADVGCCVHHEYRCSREYQRSQAAREEICVGAPDLLLTPTKATPTRQPTCSLPLMRQLFIAGLTGFVFSCGCAALLPSTDPGTPGGGKYCNRIPHEDELQCYPTERERAAAFHGQAAPASPEQLAAQRTRLAEVAAQLAEVAAQQERLDQVRVAEAQRREDEKASREADRERREQERAQKDQADKDRGAEVARMAADKAYAVPAISAIICTIQDEMADDRASLDREKRVAAIGGATDLHARHELSSELVEDADELKVWRAALRRFGGSLVPCKDLVGVIKCRNSAVRDCDDASRDIAAVWYEQFETLWGSPERHRGR